MNLHDEAKRILMILRQLQDHRIDDDDLMVGYLENALKRAHLDGKQTMLNEINEESKNE